MKLDVEGIRKEFWSMGRPGWTAATKKAMMQLYPDQHVSIAGAVLLTLKSGQDRRHIYAFDQMVTSHVSELNSMTYDDAKQNLGSWGHAPASSTEAAIKAALKKYLAKEFNKIDNLFVDDAAYNQMIGRQMETAEQNRNKAMASGDQSKADQELRSIAKNATDVPKGTTTGKALGIAENTAISTIRTTSIREFAALKGHSAQAKQGKASPIINDLWKDAEDVKENLHRNINIIALFSKSGNLSANQSIRAAIESGIEKLRLLADYMR